MSDAASHGVPHLDSSELRHTLSVFEVEAQLLAAGVPRSRRQVIRYCETAMLDAIKVPGPTGPQWFVAPASVPKAIGDLKQWQEQRARRGAPRPDVAGSVVAAERLSANTDAASQSAPRQGVSEKKVEAEESSTEPDTPRYVAQLEKRIEEKDDVIVLLKGQLVAKDAQISELSTRYRETHTLLGAMQRMFAPLLGQGDPFTNSETREGEAPKL